MLALVVGVLAGWLVFGGDDDAEAVEGGVADVAAGCQLLGGLPDEIDLEDDGWAIDGPWLWRLQGASSAFTAAARADDAYEDLAEPGERMMRAYQMFQVEEATAAIADLRDECVEQGLAPSD